jgi:hypothetical protein
MLRKESRAWRSLARLPADDGLTARAARTKSDVC